MYFIKWPIKPVATYYTETPQELTIENSATLVNTCLTKNPTRCVILHMGLISFSYQFNLNR